MKTLTELVAWVAALTVPEVSDPWPAAFDITFEQIANRHAFLLDRLLGGDEDAGYDTVIASGTTAGGAGATALGTWAIPDDTTALVELRAVAKDSTGDAAAYVGQMVVSRHGGAAATTVSAFALSTTVEDDAAWACTMSLVANDVQINVTGDITNDTEWNVRLSIVDLP